jgi:heptose II phosphotransferase
MLPSFEHRQYRVISYLDEKTGQQLVDAVIDGSLIRDKAFRDNSRTLSAKVRFVDDTLLLKVPRARNSRKWERFLTRFRESDALRTFRHLELMAAMNFSAPAPVLAAERRENGMVVDSFVCYRFVDGRAAVPEDAGKILEGLRALHRRGYLRNDAQLANFLMVGNEVTFIDFRLKKPWLFPELQKARELDRFVRSCPPARRLLDNGDVPSGWLWLASGLERIRFGLRNFKKKVRRKLKNRVSGK